MWTMKTKDKRRIVPKLSSDNLGRSPLNICFGFSYMSFDSSHGFEYFRKSASDKCKAYEHLHKRLYELSQITVTEARDRGKTAGLEKIPLKQMSNKIQSICIQENLATDETKLTVFRFGQQKYRIICKDDIYQPNLMHVIAFDFDYSAYNH